MSTYKDGTPQGIELIGKHLCAAGREDRISLPNILTGKDLSGLGRLLQEMLETIFRAVEEIDDIYRRKFYV